jgi:hypothetical protein
MCVLFAVKFLERTAQVRYRCFASPFAYFVHKRVFLAFDSVKPFLNAVVIMLDIVGEILIPLGKAHIVCKAGATTVTR